MEPESNDLLDRRNLLETLLALGRDRQTGVLRVTAGETVSLFLLDSGAITAAGWGSEPAGLLGALVEQAGLVPDKILKKALKRAETQAIDLAAALSQEGGPAPAFLREMLTTAVEEELWRVAGHEGAWWHFEPGLPDPSPFDPGVAALNLRLDVEFVVIDIAGRETDWAVLDQVFPARTAVLVTRSASRRYFEAGAGRFEEEQSVLVLLDGERDVEEILQDSPLDPYQTLKLLHRFEAMGEIRELNPAELVQVATVFKTKGRFDKCLRLYLQAETVGQGAFDLDLTIGHIYETIGKKDEALARYLSFAETCLNAGERGSGTEAFRRAVHLMPASIETREKFLQMLDPVENRAEYLEEMRTYLELVKAAGDGERMRRALRALVTAGSASVEDLKDYVALERRERGPRDAFQELHRIARQLLDDERHAEALPVLEAATELRPDSLEAQRSLAEVYARQNRRPQAAEVLHRVAALLRKGPRTDEARERLGEVYAQLLELDPNHVEALRFLAAQAHRRRDDAQAIAYLLRLKTLHAQEGNRARLARVLSRLIALQPDDPDLHLEFADCQLAAGRPGRGAEALRQAAARLAAADETRERAEALYRRVLEILPYDRAARRALATLHAAVGDREAARREWERLAEIALADGHAAEAAEILEQLHRDNPEESDYLRRLARACLAQLPAETAGARLVEVLAELVALEDFGLVRWVVRAAGNPAGSADVLTRIPDLGRIAELEKELRSVKAGIENQLKQARAAWEKELESLLRAHDREVEARLRLAVESSAAGNAADAELPTVVVPSPEDDEIEGLSGGIKRMETTFNLPSSIRDITRKLKG
ncbi:MAG: tetratricopeptide repeat protein, partial [Planctomycetes bacterium]|nr:tetratricopeptide repeat protein [Planctomycetota bacterium]